MVSTSKVPGRLRLAALSTARCSSSGLWKIAKRPSTKRSEEHTSELQSQSNLVCRLLLEKNKTTERLTSTSTSMGTSDWRQVLTTPLDSIAAAACLTVASTIPGDIHGAKPAGPPARMQAG